MSGPLRYPDVHGGPNRAGLLDVMRRRPGLTSVVTTVAGTLAVTAAFALPNLNVGQEPTADVCGFAVVGENEGLVGVVEEATGYAGMEEMAENQDEAVIRIAEIKAAEGQDLQPGNRFVMYVNGNRVIVDSIVQVGPHINSCADYEAVRRAASTAPAASPSVPSATPPQS